ncbi:MAG: hypothetical protein JWN76_532 [Chitinophagaceae bacterium]|nr:hypothetical protein [Chitinophagaceae bacterium]
MPTKKLHIHHIITFSTLKILLLFFVILLCCSCMFFEDPILSSAKKHRSEYFCVLETLANSTKGIRDNAFMEIDSVSCYSNGFCKNLTQSIKILKQEGLVNSFLVAKKPIGHIFLSNKKCITILIKEAEENGQIVDYLITFYYNLNDMLCGVNQLYNVNQNENITKLKIEVENIDASYTLIKVTHAKDTGL